MFPYRDENKTQRVAIVTGAIIAVNVLVWLFIQRAGSTIPLASSVCDWGLIPAGIGPRLDPSCATRLRGHG